MAQLAERFKAHPVWQTLQSLGPVLDNALNREDMDTQAPEMLSRIKFVLAFTGRRLVGADPFLFQTGPLDNINIQFQTALNEIQQFVADGSVGHLTNANTNADAVLTYLSQLNIPITTEDYIAAKEAAETYRNGLDKVLTDVVSRSTIISENLDTLRARINEAVTEITSEKTRCSTISTDFQTQFSTAQEARRQSFAASQQEQADKFSSLFADFTTKLTEVQKEFSTGQESRRQTFTETQQEQSDKFSQLFADFTTRLEEQNAEFTKQREKSDINQQAELDRLKNQFVDATTTIRDEVLARKIEVEKLVGVIGNVGVTSGYLKVANGARKTRDTPHISREFRGQMPFRFDICAAGCGSNDTKRGFRR